MFESLWAPLAGGAGTGLLGAVFSQVSDYFKQRQLHAHQLKMRELDLREMDAEHKYRVREREIEGAAREAEVDAQALVSSHSSDRATYLSVLGTLRSGAAEIVAAVAMSLVDLLRGIVRPALTIYLIWQVEQVRAEVRAVLAAAGLDGLDVGQALELYAQVVLMILYLAATALFWWFGTRNKLKAPA